MKTISLPEYALAVVVSGLFAGTTLADSFGTGGDQFNIDFVPIGNPGNAADTVTPQSGPVLHFGAVSYNYNLSTYEVTQADLQAAVNQGAATAYGAPNLGGGAWSGNQPAGQLNWYQAAAFVNWLNTSQGYAPAYNLSYNGTWSLTLASTPFSLGGGVFDLYRNAATHYFLPTEDEYYKAAYYDPNQGGPGVGGYWLYATGSNTAPTAVASGTGAGTAVYNNAGTQPAAVNLAGGLSAYGTMGQTGNMYEWVETSYAGDYNPSFPGAFRGGAWEDTATGLQSTFRTNTVISRDLGFRVAAVPEPSSAALIIGPCLMFLTRRRRRA